MKINKVIAGRAETWREQNTRRAVIEELRSGSGGRRCGGGRGGEDVMDGGDDGVGTLEGDHVVAVGHDDLAATRGEVGFADLQVIPPDEEKIVVGLYGESGRQAGGVEPFSGGEDDEGLVAQVPEARTSSALTEKTTCSEVVAARNFVCNWR